MKTAKQRVYFGAFVLPDMSFSNAYIIVSDRVNPATMLEELEEHTGQKWKHQPSYNEELDAKNEKQKIAMRRMVALMEVRNSIEEDEFQFIRFD
ncbi:hypothetical protein HXV88_08510 [Aeromonas veronii]|uniref:hypothetical protein n=1 Tax=Aeromonas veronii TaxID=654 RepID=UPI0015D02133|nr:hypothetical protein [Aeromonas veronii]QLH66493.1 hypothetical protein HXV88_08510 [Aeromonas veronii]